MPKIEESGCHGCRYGDWDADGCTCKLDGLLVWNPAVGCKYRKADEDKPLTNGDRIRAMTDEELAEWFAPHMMCNECERRLKSYGCDKGECAKYALIYMKREVSEEAFS